MKMTSFIKNTGAVAALLGMLTLSLPVYAAFTDKKPDNTPQNNDTSTCGENFGTCYKETINICKCIKCPGAQEEMPNCDCVQETDDAYFDSWNGTCKDGWFWFDYYCVFPSEPTGGGDRPNQPSCGRDQS